MDDFLTKMYEEEMEKTSAAELDTFMDSLSREELEGLLGFEGIDFTKVAVAGPVDPPMPDSLPGNELDAQMKTVEEIAAKSRTETPPTRQQEAEPTAVSHQGPGKAPTTKEAMAWADSVGRMLAKTAQAPGVTVAAGDPWRWPLDPAEGKRQGRALGGILGGVYGGMGGALPGLHAGRGRAALLGGLGGAALGGVGGALLGGRLGRKGSERERKRLKSDIAAIRQLQKESQYGEEEGMETTAAVKAKIAARALRVIQGAPPHVKQAAAKVAGACMAKQTAFTTPEAKAKARVMAKAMKMGRGASAKARKGLVSAAGKNI